MVAKPKVATVVLHDKAVRSSVVAAHEELMPAARRQGVAGCTSAVPLFWLADGAFSLAVAMITEATMGVAKKPGDFCKTCECSP